MLEVGVAMCWKGQIPPGVIRPKKEYIKSCETCFANTLTLNDKGPSLKWACFPKVLWPFSYLALTLNSPQSSLSVIYCLIITASQWLMSFVYMPCIPMQIKEIKAHWEKGFWPFSFKRSATFPPQADHVLVDLFSSVEDGGLCGQSSPAEGQALFAVF